MTDAESPEIDDTAGMRGRERRSDQWRRLYRQNRYMKHLSDDELRARADHIANNWFTITDDKIGLLGPKEGEFEWARKYTEVLEELGLRGEVHRRGKSSPMFPTPPSLGFLESVRSISLPSTPYLVRFLEKTEWAERLVNEGAIYMNPASGYLGIEDSTLRPAQVDDELSLKRTVRGEGGFLTTPDGKEHPLLGSLEITYRTNTDFYVYCMSRSLEKRLFGDFGTEACVLIRDPSSFLRRVVKGFLANHPGWYWNASDIQYVDPVRFEDREPDVFFGKDFGYAYQREFRLAFFPPKDRHDLRPVDFNVGSLEDISQLIIPPKSSS